MVVEGEGVTTLLNRVRGALWGMYIGDALSMPVHWYYDRRRIQQDFGKIEGYARPVAKFPGSIMNLSNTGGGGRGSDQGNIIGDVILHGKRDFWLRGGQYHYHHGMQPGENTLDTLLCRLLVNTIQANPDLLEVENYDNIGSLGPGGKNGGQESGSVGPSALVDKYLEEYARFMTTPGSHNDVYAATAHRMFFANWARAKKDERTSARALRTFADNDGHNTDSIDGIINVIPFTLLRVTSLPNDVDREAWVSDIINALRRSEELPQWGVLYDELLGRVLLGQPLRAAVLEVAEKINPGFIKVLKKAATTSSDSDPMTACYIQSSFPAMLVFAYKYADDPVKALLASANAGGENVNRSAILGALMGAAHGAGNFEDSSRMKNLQRGLFNADAYEQEVEKFVTLMEKRSKQTAETKKKSEL
ncbi:unnamed protein product [Amoebophrya sp. A25]|nr:unnamed protein product [Amoebophrya sp. A25]|eukprot:GSA25T00000779001.1